MGKPVPEPVTATSSIGRSGRSAPRCRGDGILAAGTMRHSIRCVPGSLPLPPSMSQTFLLGIARRHQLERTRLQVHPHAGRLAQQHRPVADPARSRRRPRTSACTSRCGGRADCATRHRRRQHGSRRHRERDRRGLASSPRRHLVTTARSSPTSPAPRLASRVASPATNATRTRNRPCSRICTVSVAERPAGSASAHIPASHCRVARVRRRRDNRRLSTTAARSPRPRRSPATRGRTSHRRRSHSARDVRVGEDHARDRGYRSRRLAVVVEEIERHLHRRDRRHAGYHVDRLPAERRDLERDAKPSPVSLTAPRSARAGVAAAGARRG